MPRTPLPWFRFYGETMRDAKLRTRPVEERWSWAAILTIAGESPQRGHLYIAEGIPAAVEHVADLANVPVKSAASAIEYFLGAPKMLIVCEHGVWFVTKWKERQFESDTSTPRTRKNRSKEQGRNVPTGDEGTSRPSGSTDLRFAEDASDADASSSSDDDDPIFTEALRLTAERKMVGKAIDDRSRYRTTVMDTDRREFAAFRAEHPELDVEELLRAFEYGPETIDAERRREVSSAAIERGRLLTERRLALINEDLDDVAIIDARLAELEVAS